MKHVIYVTATKDLYSMANDGEPVASDADLAVLGRTKKVVASFDGVWDKLALDFVAPPAPVVVVPFVTQAAANTWLKTFLETNPTTWTAGQWDNQQRYAVYALVLLSVFDYKQGKAY